MDMPDPLPISGYILAGGRSSRMGADKSLLPLAGKPLIAHAVAKLRGICTSVHILSANPTLAAYAPLVPDLHPNCGPVGGIEAALAHTKHDWNLILAVDIPFLPAAILHRWAAHITAPTQTIRVAMFTAGGRPQPAVCLLHKQIAPSIAAAVALEEFKLLPVLEAVANVLALQENQPLDQFLSFTDAGAPHLGVPGQLAGWGEHLTSEMWVHADAQKTAQPLWFTNLNTPQDLAMAEANIAALDT
jgi:molybdopterin-guanine dinucleotide biosynthesis protein A